MGPDRLIPYPPRLWKVDIVRTGGRQVAVCRACGPLDSACAADQPLRSRVLSHLARHARCDVTPAHLRTCQCGRCGCRWHPRRRPCSGPVRLTLVHEANSRVWRLTDTCSQCRCAIPSAAAVPEPARPAPAVATSGSLSPGRPGSAPQGGPPAGAEPGQVWEVTCLRCGLPPDACWWTHNPADPA